MGHRIMVGLGVVGVSMLLATWYLMIQAMVVAESFALVMCQ